MPRFNRTTKQLVASDFAAFSGTSASKTAGAHLKRPALVLGASVVHHAPSCGRKRSASVPDMEQRRRRVAGGGYPSVYRRTW
eukprot:2546995-Rhodomonas_salina.1